MDYFSQFEPASIQPMKRKGTLLMAVQYQKPQIEPVKTTPARLLCKAKAI
jgi:hypothetical protein